MAAGQFPEVLVEGNQHTVFTLGPRQNTYIRKAGLVITNPRNIQPTLTQHPHCRARHILIGQEAHQLGRDRVDAYVPERFGHVGVTGL